ncbi:MAG: sigma-70 family RNA polymerase sigma factor [Myxococcales bacterium]|nr:sigma-70 family RNA polymerase sigma factor [Myxococcales bacterium]
MDALGEKTYQQLRRMAAARFRNQGPITLQPTALVHEAWMKISGADPATDREHFLARAAQAMRQVLIDQARARGAQKRGGDQVRVSLSGAEGAGTDGGLADVLALDQALAALAQVDARRAQVVELRFFGGLEMSEVAEVVGVSLATAERDWRAARAWLQVQLTAGD